MTLDQTVPMLFEPVKSAEATLPARINRRLRQAIESGQLGPGARLPSEPVLAQQLGVSRASLREALRILERDRLLSRRPGVGTYVTSQAALSLQRGLDELFSTTELIESHGFRAGTVGVVVRQILATAELATALDLPATAHLVHLSRTRLANEAPVIQCEEYLPLRLFEAVGVDPAELQAVTSLYAFMASRLGWVVEMARTNVVPCVASGRLAARLGIRRGHPLLLLEQVHLSSGQRPLVVSRNYHNPDLIRFRLTRRSQH